MSTIISLGIIVAVGALMLMQQGNERQKRLHDLRRARYVREQEKKGLTK